MKSVFKFDQCREGRSFIIRCRFYKIAIFKYFDRKDLDKLLLRGDLFVLKQSQTINLLINISCSLLVFNEILVGMVPFCLARLNFENVNIFYLGPNIEDLLLNNTEQDID